MRYIEFRKHLIEMPVFDLIEIKKIDDNFDTRRLYEWQKKDYIKKIFNGHYMFSDYKITEDLLFFIANRIYKHSYISLETALHYHNMIPEQPYTVVSVSTKKTAYFETQIGNFQYRKMLSKFFFGYKVEKAGEFHVKIASAEKALIDYFYFNTHLRTIDDVISIRIIPDVFNEVIDTNVLKTYVKIVDNKRVKRCMKYLLMEMNNA